VLSSYRMVGERWKPRATQTKAAYTGKIDQPISDITNDLANFNQSNLLLSMSSAEAVRYLYVTRNMRATAIRDAYSCFRLMNGRMR